MTSNDAAVLGGAAVPLLQALPWAPAHCPRTFLVNDSMSADGRFLLYALAYQATNCPILWLAGGPITPTQIQQGLKKMGCTIINTTKLTVRSLTEELANAVLKEETFQDEEFVPRVYQSILDWLENKQDNNESADVDVVPWIILEDVSALASLLGEASIFNLILALNSKSKDSNKPFGLLLRSSNDQEKESLPTYAGTSAGQQQQEDSFGASGSMPGPVTPTIAATFIPWERSLVEMADAVLDVLPLTSGYTRELQGRIVLSHWPLSRGWRDPGVGQQQQQQQQQQLQHKSQKQSYPATQIINYGITDHAIMAYIM